MILPEISIRRHVFAWMLSGILMLFGWISYSRIGVDRFPTVEFPMISVTTILPGAHPSIVDASITSLIEEKVNTVPGIEYVTAQSSPGVSIVMVQFELSKNPDVAFNEVQAKVNQALRALPKGIDPPQVAKMEIGASPVIWLALTGDRTLQQLNQYARNVIKKRLENISGVGEVRLGGERKRNLRVWLDLNRMDGLKVTIPEIVAAFEREHVQFPGGFLVGDRREYLIKLDFEAHSARQLERLVVAARGGGRIRLGDIARIEDGMADARQFAHFNGQPAVGIGVVKVSGANTVAIADEVKRRLASEIIPALPPGLELHISSDDSLIIKSIVAGLKEHLLLSTLLAALVVLIFLKNFTSTVIVSIAMPVSLLAALAVSYSFGFTLNMMTLLAMLLLVGVVVDDAIVVLENIYRKREEEPDLDGVTAAVEGSRQVAFAVVAASLTLVAIFAPVIFMEGMIGRFFKAFAVIVTFGTLASLFVALTLTPMLCSRYLKVERKHGPLYARFDRAFHALDNFYRQSLDWALHHRAKVLMATFGVLLASGFLFALVGKTFTPEEDEGRFMVIFKAPLGASLADTEQKVQQVEAILKRHPDVRGFFTAVGSGQNGQVNQGMAIVHLTPKGGRRKQWEIMPEIQAQLSTIPGLRAFATKMSIVGGMRGEPLQFAVVGPNLEKVGEVARSLHGQLQQIDGLGKVDLDLQLDLPELEVTFDRERARDLGIAGSDVGLAINVLAGGYDVARFNDEPGDGNRYEIRLQADRKQLKYPTDLSRVWLRSASGQMVRLDTIAHWQPKLGPAVIPKADLRYSGVFYSTPTLPLGAAVAEVKLKAADLLPPGYSILLLGQAAEFEKTARNMMFAFGLAMMLVYMVLASQFNSFLQPLVLMLAQPLAIIGGVAALWITGQTLNIFSMIGLVLLVGLVAKNSILLIDLTNQARAAGAGIDEALRYACPIRMRPVLMTSMTIIFALLPTALAIGEGSEMTVPLAIAVIGGMISSTLLTLVVVPSAYSLLMHGLERMQGWRARRRAAAEGVER